MATNKDNIIICDLDGCLVNTAWIWKIINGMGFENELAFDLFNRMANAEVVQVDLTLLNYLRLRISAGIRILFLTARSEIIETETINFIQKKTGLKYGEHFSINCRPKTDTSSPVESKAARLQNIIDNGRKIIIAIDDEDEIIRMYESKNIKAMKWANGFIPLSVAAEYGSNINILLGIKEVLNQN